MSRKLVIFLSYIIIALFFFGLGILFSEKTNYKFSKSKEKNQEIEKIAVSTFIVSRNNDTKKFVSSKDLRISDELVSTYRELINSNTIKNKIKEEYSDIKNIELEKIDGTEMLKAIYVCENYNENDCIEINNKYISLFAEIISDIYNVNIVIIDSASISTRIVENT